MTTEEKLVGLKYVGPLAKPIVSADGIWIEFDGDEAVGVPEEFAKRVSDGNPDDWRVVKTYRRSYRPDLLPAVEIDDLPPLVAESLTPKDQESADEPAEEPGEPAGDPTPDADRGE